jgi:ABC-type multidrug transport system fused ATPase/permease subunit
MYGFIEEQLAGTEDIRSSGAVDFSIRELFRHQAEILKHNRKAHFKRWIIENAMGLALTTGTLLAITADIGSSLWASSPSARSIFSCITSTCSKNRSGQ